MRKQTKLIAVLSATALLAIGAAMTSFAATGWQEEDGSWVYYDSDNYQVTSTWKKSGDFWYYLDEDGYMATEKLIDDTFYVDENGVMVTNQWVEISNDEESGDPEDPESYWYYFGNNGKAYTGESGKAVFKKINGQKYIFDTDGKMLYGWISEDGDRLTEDEDWKTALYYCGEEGNGAQATGWQELEVVNDNETKTYWFYFGTNGKKVSDDNSKKINGYYYSFATTGKMNSGWVMVAASGSDVTDINNYKYFGGSASGARVSGWFNVVPKDKVNQEANDNDDAKWYYAKSNGELISSEIKSVNSKKYAFNENGEMVSGLVDIVLASDSNIVSIDEVENVDDAIAGAVYYFGGEEDGSMKLASQNVTVDGEVYTYYFTKDGSHKGEGLNKIYNNAVYKNGRKLTASSDLRYDTVEYGKDTYVVNTSGTIMKNKKNLKNLDDMYYCTDKDGKLIHKGYDKCDTTH